MMRLRPKAVRAPARESGASDELGPRQAYSRRDRAAFLGTLFLVGTCSYVDKNVVGVVLEQIKAEFLVSDAMLGLLSGISFALLYSTLGIPLSRWADRGDRKLIINLSLAFWSFATLLCGFAGTFWQLVAARFGVGAGEAGAIPPAQSLIADYYPPAKRAWAIGIFMMSASAGFAIGLVLGGFVAHHYGWRAVFIGCGLAGFLILPLTQWLLKEPRRIAHPPAALARRESVRSALRALLVKPSYRLLLCAIIAQWLLSYGAMVFTVPFLMRAHELNVAQAGLLFGVVAAVAGVIGNLAGGFLSDRLAHRSMASPARLGGSVLIAALPCYELALWAGSLTGVVPLLFFSMIFLTASMPPMFSSLHRVCGSSRRAFAVAVTLFFANLIGLGLGPLITGVLSDAFALRYGSADGLRYGLMAVMLILLVPSWLMWRAARHIERDAED